MSKDVNIVERRRESSANKVVFGEPPESRFDFPSPTSKAAAVTRLASAGMRARAHTTTILASFRCWKKLALSGAKPPASLGLSDFPVSQLLNALVDR
jgi:hypothetical protein